MYLVHYLHHKWYDNSKTQEGYRVSKERPSFKADKDRIKERMKKHKKGVQFTREHFGWITSKNPGYSEILRFAKIGDKMCWQYPSLK